MTGFAAKTPWADSPRPAIVAAGLASSACLWWSARWPWFVCLSGAVGYAVSGNPWPLLVALFIAGMHRRWPLGFLALMVGTIGFISRDVIDAERLTIGAVESAAAIAVGVLAVGVYVGTQRALVASLRRQAEHAETERVLRDEQSRAEERSRIAREMHDVVAHQVALIALHAGALEVNPEIDRGSVIRSAELIRTTARQALTELREVLSALRPNGVSTDPDGQLPTVAELVGAAQAAGMTIALTNETAPLPPLAERAAVRVVQEAITNATRYGPGAPVEVFVGQTDDRSVVVVVTNDRPAQPPDGEELRGSGRGLVGLSERLRLLGGALVVGPNAEGGWRVEARIPVQAPPLLDAFAEQR